MSTKYLSNLSTKNQDINLRVNRIVIDSPYGMFPTGNQEFKLYFQTQGFFTNDVSITVPVAMRITGLKVISRGAGGPGDYVVVRKGTFDISNQIDLSTAIDREVLRESSLNRDHWSLDVGDVLNVFAHHATTLPELDVYVEGYFLP